MGLLENMKEVADLIKKAGDIDLYRKIVESEGEVVELTRENRRLEEKVAELQKKLALQAVMRFDRPFYWQEGDETPYCPHCWEAGGMGCTLSSSSMKVPGHDGTVLTADRFIRLTAKQGAAAPGTLELVRTILRLHGLSQHVLMAQAMI